MARDHLIVPVYIPHEGCPYRCVFCNQNKITGFSEKADSETVDNALDLYLSDQSKRDLPVKREVAFYGGTFTGLPIERQAFLLSCVQPWIESGWVTSVRLSTHPDWIDPDNLEWLKGRGVRTVELGIQSTNEKVLELSGRPGSLNTMSASVKWIQQANLKLGLQLMPGLPGDDDLRFQESVDQVIRWKPDFVRLYPSLVLKGTRMHRLYESGEYRPWSLDQTINSLKTALVKLGKAGIPVIRLGLQPDPSLMENFVAGPFHPALRYLIESRLYFDRMVGHLESTPQVNKRVIFRVPSKNISNFMGHRKENIIKLKQLFGLEEVRFEADKHLEELELVA